MQHCQQLPVSWRHAEKVHETLLEQNLLTLVPTLPEWDMAMPFEDSLQLLSLFCDLRSSCTATC